MQVLQCVVTSVSAKYFILRTSLITVANVIYSLLLLFYLLFFWINVFDWNINEILGFKEAVLFCERKDAVVRMDFPEGAWLSLHTQCFHV